MTTAEELKERLGKHLNLQLELKLNENRRTMLSVLDRRRKFARLSVHKMFLDAPEDVLSAIASYVKGQRKEGDLRLRNYIQANLKHYDYSDRINSHKMVTEGEHYDLKKIFDEVNAEYFGGHFKAHITWFGTAGRKNHSRVIFGLYLEQLRLIKIHRILDDPFFPEYFVRFIVYHEMLHGVIPGYVDERGFFRTHGPAFKRKERQYAEFERAIAWEKEHRKAFFAKRGTHGWA